MVGPLFYRRWFSRQPLDDKFLKNGIDGVTNRAIHFAELTPEFLRQEVQKIMAEQAASILDSDAMRDYLGAMERKRRRRF